MIFFSMAEVLHAQPADREIVNQSISWLSATTNLKISSRLTIILDGQFRFMGNLDPMQQQARTGLDIKINDHLSVAPLAYVHTWNFLYGKQPLAFANNEHRIWQQIFYKHDLGRIKADHRLRVEQRFLKVQKQSGEDIVDEGYTNRQNRLRYRFMARIPIGKLNIDPKTFFVSVYEEVFFSWGKPVSFHEPDQNRIFAGGGLQVNKTLSIQGGFLYQMLIKSNGVEQENNTGLKLILTYNPDLTKPGKE